MLSVSFSQVSGFVQNVCNQETFSIYYKKSDHDGCIITSFYLPQHFETVSPRICSIITRAMNSLLVDREVYVANWYFTVYGESTNL